MLWWVCVGILGLSASISCNSEFFYSQNIVRRSDECNLCFEKDCFTLDKARCDYYAEADSILPKDVETPGGAEDAAKRKEVDDLMFDLVDKPLPGNMECIPYVSRYTNCNKENVCLDCKTCSCSPEGKWLCTTTVPCHSQDPPLNVDHRVLVMIMEALAENTPPKKTKRAVTENPKAVASTITLEKISEWLYGAKPLHMQDAGSKGITTTDFTLFWDDEPVSEIATTVTAPDLLLSGLTTTESITETANNEDADYIAFDEVLRSIAVDPKPYNRRKPLDTEPIDSVNKNQSRSIDYMMMAEDNVTSGTANDHLGEVINFMLDYDDVVTETAVTNATEVVIDLLPAGNIGNVNITENSINKDKYLDPIFFDKTNDIMEYNALNIMKRDVTGQENITAPNTVPTVTIIVNTTNTTTKNVTEEFPELKNNVLIPLNKIISDKIKELENLQRIKEDLIKFVKSNSPEDIPAENNTTSGTSFSIYNIAMKTGLDIDLRRANPSKYDNYMLKLKSDIFTVLRDMAIIQRLKNAEIPEDLKFLMHAMKRYVYKTKQVEKPKKTKLRRQKSFRRRMVQTSRCDRLSFKDCLVLIIEVIDKDSPISNALSALSLTSRKIMKHVIKTYYINQNVMPGLRAHNPHYNLTNYLNSIGSKWQQLSAILLRSNPLESVHRMKLLHCTLMLDISKLHDAIGIVEFAYSRRMVTILDKVSDNTLDRIDTGLTTIHNKIRMFIKYYKRLPTKQATEQPRAMTKENTTKTTPTMKKDVVETRKGKKRSFIKHIRNLLKTSKNDIAELLHKKVPKSDIVKELARKRLDEMSEKRYGEYEETMKRWQQNLDITARMKRSVLDQLKVRSLKNIIPKYLRHKVNPRIKEKQKNATSVADRKSNARKNERKNRINERKDIKNDRKDRKNEKNDRKTSRRGIRARKTTVSKSSITTALKSKKPESLKTKKVTRAPTTRKPINSTILKSKTH